MFFSRRAREAVLKNMKTVDGAHEAPASSNPNTAAASASSMPKPCTRAIATTFLEAGYESGCLPEFSSIEFQLPVVVQFDWHRLLFLFLELYISPNFLLFPPVGE